jgi:hypothetical protein
VSRFDALRHSLCQWTRKRKRMFHQNRP